MEKWEIVVCNIKYTHCSGQVCSLHQASLTKLSHRASAAALGKAEKSNLLGGVMSNSLSPIQPAANATHGPEACSGSHRRGVGSMTRKTIHPKKADPKEAHPSEAWVL